MCNMATKTALSKWGHIVRKDSATPGSAPERRGMAITAMLNNDTRGLIPTDSTHRFPITPQHGGHA